MPTITGFSHVSFSVSDLARSIAFYQDVLGFAVTAEVEGDGFARTRLRHPGSGITLTLTRHHPGPGDRFDERRTGLDHLARSVPDVNDIAAWLHRLEEHGVDHSEVKPVGRGAP